MSARELLSQSKLEVSPENFWLVSLGHTEWTKLLGDPALSPRGSAPFMIFSDKHEVTLLLDEIDFGTIRHAIRDAKTEGGFRLLTFDVEMDFSVVGFLAGITRIFAEAEISVVALSAFSRDHILVKQADLALTLKILGPHIGDLC